MPNVFNRQRLAPLHPPNSLPYQDAVHNNAGPNRQIFGRKLMLRRDSRYQRICRSVELHNISLLEIAECDQHVVASIELQDLPHSICEIMFYLSACRFPTSVAAPSRPRAAMSRSRAPNFQNRSAFPPKTASRTSLENLLK